MLQPQLLLLASYSERLWSCGCCGAPGGSVLSLAPSDTVSHPRNSASVVYLWDCNECWILQSGEMEKGKQSLLAKWITLWSVSILLLFWNNGVFYYSFSKALSLLFTVLNILSNERVSSIICFLPLYLPTLLASRCSYFCSITQEPHFFGYAGGPGLFSSLFTGKKVKRTTTQWSF